MCYSKLFSRGDLHSNATGEMRYLSSKTFPEGKKLNKNDIVWIQGDFGFLFQQTMSEHEAHGLNWLHEKPWTTIFEDGNHENFPRLAKLETVEKFGGQMGKVNDSVFHAHRGEIYTIDGHTIFVMGGALSVDKNLRIPGLSWWREEEPSHKEMDYALGNLEKVGHKVDYIFTHTLPTRYASQIVTMENMTKILDPTCAFLDEVEERTEFKEWYAGHFHVDKEFTSPKGQRIYAQYNGIRRVF